MSFNITYKPLFEIRILHQYYLNFTTNSREQAYTLSSINDVHQQLFKAFQVSSFLKVIPSKDTEEILNNHKIVFRPTNYGCKLFIALKSGSQNPQRPLSSEFRLRFYLDLLSPYFFNFTDLPLSNPNGRTFYYHNLRREGQNVPAFKKLYNWGEGYVSATDEIMGTGNFLTVPVIRPTTLEIKNHFGQTVKSYLILKDDENNPSTSYSLSLEELPGGYYEIRGIHDPNINNRKIIYKDVELNRSDYFGIVEIYDRLAARGFEIMGRANGAIFDPAPIFYLWFNRRRTTWRYFRKNPANRQKQQVARFNNRPLLQFPTKLQNNNRALPNPSVATLNQVGNNLFSDVYL